MSGSSQNIALRHVDGLLRTSFKRRWNHRYIEVLEARTPERNRIYCPRRSCGKFIQSDEDLDIRKSNSERAICSSCDTKVCVKCRRKWHWFLPCPTRKVREASEAERPSVQDELEGESPRTAREELAATKMNERTTEVCVKCRRGWHGTLPCTCVPRRHRRLSSLVYRVSMNEMLGYGCEGLEVGHGMTPSI